MGKIHDDGYNYAAGLLLRKQLTPEELRGEQDGHPNEFDFGMDAAIADFKNLMGELAKLEKWVDDLQSGMYINCVYCGFQYGPREGVIARKALEDHIASCPKHPLSLCKKELAASRSLEARFFPQTYAHQTAEKLIAAGFGRSAKHGNTLLGMIEECLDKIDSLSFLHNLDHSLADQWQKKNEAMMEFFVGAGYEKLNEIPSLPADDLRRLGETTATRISELKTKADAFDKISRAASILVANAVIGPDASMNGSTDCFHVPLDDIDALREALKP